MSGLFEFSIPLFRGDNMHTGGNVLYLLILTYFSKSKRGKNMPTTVPPALGVLSLARASRKFQKAVFMKSVSHGKVWTKNMASSYKNSVL
jgi:hypothetical protein